MARQFLTSLTTEDGLVTGGVFSLIELSDLPGGGVGTITIGEAIAAGDASGKLLYESLTGTLAETGGYRVDAAVSGLIVCNWNTGNVPVEPTFAPGEWSMVLDETTVYGPTVKIMGRGSDNVEFYYRPRLAFGLPIAGPGTATNDDGSICYQNLGGNLDQAAPGVFTYTEASGMLRSPSHVTTATAAQTAGDFNNGELALWLDATAGAPLIHFRGKDAAGNVFDVSPGTGIGTVTSVNLTAPAAGITVSGGPITTSGSITLALADDLAAVEGLASTGMAARTGASTWAVRTITGPAAGITVTNGDGASGNPTLALADDLAALEALSGTDTIYYRSGVSTWTAVTIGSGLSFSGGSLSATGGGGTVTSVNLTAPAAGITVSGGPITTSGSITLALADDLAALEGLASTGLAARTGVSTWAVRTLTAPAAGITVTNGGGVAGDPTLALANDLAAVEGLAGTGVAVRTATDTWTTRTITGTSNRITLTNGDGVAGAPTIDIAATYVGQTSITTLGTIATGTWSATTIAVDKGGTGQTSYTNGQLLIGNTTGNTLAKGTLTAPAAGITITNGAGSITFALADDLSGLEGLATTGLAARTAASTWTTRTLTGPAAGITVSNGDGVSGNPTLALADDLAALEALSGTNTIYYRSAASTWTAVTISTGLSFSGGSLSCTVTGTVTSVQVSGGTTGLTFSGGPITTSGTITMAGTLAVLNGGTGATTASGARTNLGLGTISTQNADNVNITGGTAVLDQLQLKTAGVGTNIVFAASVTGGGGSQTFTLTLPSAAAGLTYSGSYTLTVAGTASVSGTNTGDQTITLTGDVTGTGTGSFATTLKTITSFTGADPAAGDEMLGYDLSATANRKFQLDRMLGLARRDPGGRLTLSTGTPVTTSDVTGATTVYYTPYLHDAIVLWDGTRWVASTFAETSLALGTVTSALPYDIFGYLSSGTFTLEKLAWTSATARATAITIQDGRYCKSGDKTRLYLGTIFTTSTTATEDSITKRFVWNMYNRVPRPMFKAETGASNWSYTTASWRSANNNTAIRLEIIRGLNEDAVQISNLAASQSSAGATTSCGIGLDSTSSPTGASPLLGGGGVAYYQSGTAAYDGFPGLGYHYFQSLEYGGTSASFFGNNAPFQTAAIYGNVMA